MIDWLLPQILGGSAQRRLAARGALVFTYHSISAPPPGARDPFLHVCPADFAAQLARLRDCGLAPATLDDLISASPANVAVVTFDDGRRDVWQHALEPLARHGFRATQFLVADLLGGVNEWDAVHGDASVPLMDAAQVRDWLAAGHSIGSHTLAHRNLTKLDAAAAREQIAGGKKRLEDMFGVPVRHFAYPHGQWNERVRDLVAEAGYATACSTAFGVNALATPRLALRRIAPLDARALAAKALHRLARRVRKS